MKKKLLIPTIAATILPCVAATAINWQKRGESQMDNMCKNEYEKALERLPMTREENKTRGSEKAGAEYLVVGKSIYNDDGTNAYAAGGNPVSYPCYVSFDDASGKVTFDGLFREAAVEGLLPAEMEWDASIGKIHADTPSSFSKIEDCVYLGRYNEEIVFALQGGEAYGIGYWRKFKEMNMEVSSDRSVITPASAFSCTPYMWDEWDEEYIARNPEEVMYDTRLYLRQEGVSAISSTDRLDFGRSFIGESRTLRFNIINPGKEEGDFVISISNPAFKVNVPTGSLEAGSCTELEVTFTPTEIGEYENELIIMTDDYESKVMLHGLGENKPDYSRIVTSGADLMTFDTDNEYPFTLSSEFGESLVAVSSNAGKEYSSSWLETKLEIPEGFRGTLAYTGYFYPRWAAYDEVHISVDGEDVFATDTDKQYKSELDGELPLLPGSHSVRFEYKKGAMFNSYAIEMGEDYAYISSIDLTLEPYVAQKATLNTDKYDFGTVYSDKENVKAISETDIILRNDGYEILEIISTGDTENFTIDAPKTLKPNAKEALGIIFNGTERKQYDETLTLVTSAGSLPINLRINVEDYPDYSQIVNKGEFEFEVGRHPFVVKDGVAVNPTLPTDGAEVISEFTARYAVPEGKYGLLTWTGHADCGDGDEGLIMFDNDAYSILEYTGNVDAGAYSANATSCWVEGGEHMISFGYIHSGFSKYDGANKLSISNLSLEIIDEMPPLVLWEPTPIEFKPLYPGTKDYHQLILYNLDYAGWENVAITSVETPENFACDFKASSFSSIPTYATACLTIAAAPEAVGRFEEEFVLQTSKGEYKIPVVCEGKDDSAVIYHEEFENEELPGWTVVDRNEDDKTWSFGSEKLANTGKGCLIFNSNFLKENADDYILSPDITIPESGAILVYWRAYSNEDPAHDYAVMVGEGDNVENYVSINVENGISTDKDFEKINVDLSQYAGKTVRICFANKTEKGQKNVLKIDDLAVIAKGGSVGVTSAVGKLTVKSSKYYSIDGMEVDHPKSGFYIVKETLSDGTERIIRKKLR